jgi:ribosome-associated protein
MSLEKKMLQTIITSLEDKKAEDIKTIDISNICSFSNYFIIASGTNNNQVQAMADIIEENLKPLYKEEHKVEGYQKANWILLDYGNIIIHLFDQTSRDFYKLEKMWKDGKIITTP